MNTIKVKKDELRATVTANHASHKNIFEAVSRMYRDRCIEELGRRLDAARSGGKFNPFLNLQPPQDHSDDYLRILKQLEMSVEDTITLTDGEFAQYVMDDWNWKGLFTSTNAFYAGTTLDE